MSKCQMSNVLCTNKHKHHSATRWHISKMFLNFELEIFVSGSISLGFGCFPNTPATLEHSEVIFQGGDSLGVSKPWFFGSKFEYQLPLRYWVSNNEWVVKKCGMDSGCPLKSTSTHNSHNSGSYERFSAGSIISWIGGLPTPLRIR